MKLVVLLFAIVLISACSDGKFSSPSGSITSTQAAAFAQLTGSTSPASAVKVNTSSAPSDLPTSGLREGTSETCTTVDPVTAVDADSDGIKASQKTTWDCTNVESGDERSTTYTRKGTRIETDKDDANKYGGYKYEYDVEGNGTSGNVNFNYEYRGYWELTRSTRQGAQAARGAAEKETRARTWSYNTDWEGNYAYSGGHSHYGSWGHTFEYEVTENSAREDAGKDSREEELSGKGTASFSGFYQYKGSVDSRSEIDVIFRVESQDLTWERSGCPNYYSGGRIQWTDGSGNIMVWIYTSCSAMIVQFNGSTVYQKS